MHLLRTSYGNTVVVVVVVVYNVVYVFPPYCILSLRAHVQGPGVYRLTRSTRCTLRIRNITT